MAAGGKRSGAGRKKGIPNRRTREVMDAALASGASPLDIMLGAARAAWERAHEGDDVDLDMAKLAAEIAKDAAPYVHAKLAPIQPQGGETDDERARKLREALSEAQALEEAE